MVLTEAPRSSSQTPPRPDPAPAEERPGTERGGEPGPGPRAGPSPDPKPNHQKPAESSHESAWRPERKRSSGHDGQMTGNLHQPHSTPTPPEGAPRPPGADGRTKTPSGNGPSTPSGPIAWPRLSCGVKRRIGARPDPKDRKHHRKCPRRYSLRPDTKRRDREDQPPHATGSAHSTWRPDRGTS